MKRTKLLLLVFVTAIVLVLYLATVISTAERQGRTNKQQVKKQSLPDILLYWRPVLAVVAVVLAVNACDAKKAELARKIPFPETSESTKKMSLPKTEAECVARGGGWIFAGPQNVMKYCSIATTDGGKSCKSSSQCQSECVEKNSGNVCAQSFDGCFQPTGRGTVTECVY